MEEMWRIELFGGVRALRGGIEVERCPNQKAVALLGYLAYHRTAHSREVLIDLFWPEDDAARARHKLSMALTALRQHLEPAGIGDGVIIQADRLMVRLAEGAVTTDVAEFDAALRQAAAADTATRAHHLARAVELYRGDLLSGCYENWIFGAQERLLHRFLEALHDLIALHVAEGEPGKALETALRAATADPLSEPLHQEVMRLQLLLGRPTAALRQYEEMERLLRDELDALPSPESQALAHQARQALSTSPERPAPARTAPFPAPEAERATPTPVPEPLVGAVPLGSSLYVARRADEEVSAALRSQSSIVLLHGARQVGKSSLLGRALEDARLAGARVVTTDFQGLSASDRQSPEALLKALAREIADQLDLDVDPAESMGPERSPGVGFRRFLRREVLGHASAPLVWGMDEVDRLFACDFHSEIFGLFRSWHNQRVLDPSGPWGRLTQVIAYATEAHLFITDLHQSPFNVGTRIDLVDFTREQLAALNLRYGSPLRSAAEVEAFFGLVGGHPYLVQQGLRYAAARAAKAGGPSLADVALDPAGPFGDHLRRMMLLLGRAPELCEAVREVLRGRPCPTPESFYRLRSSGILAGPSSEAAQPRCGLYARCLTGYLLPES
jgi:DNA-binding SARP family transcriptional activator